MLQHVHIFFFFAEHQLVLHRVEGGKAHHPYIFFFNFNGINHAFALFACVAIAAGTTYSIIFFIYIEFRLAVFQYLRKQRIFRTAFVDAVIKISRACNSQKTAVYHRGFNIQYG
ncbi:hypothetical protein SDC9_105645 [bioreactor metagenome]|uniref:Uncharacterized protein n=1 Tax=bioreactor metagenome TaxID=1076179 RepID=A0A645B045_9ZZZZ